MLIPLAAALLMTVSAEPTEKQLRFAAMEINAIGFGSTKKDKDFIGFLSDHGADQFAAAGLRVTTPKEIKALIGLERQRQLMGCAEGTSSCAAELANALGVDGLILTDVARVGSVYKLNVKVLDATSTERVASYSGKVSSQEALLDAFTEAAKQLAPTLREKFGAKQGKQTPLSEITVPEQKPQPIVEAKSEEPKGEVTSAPPVEVVEPAKKTNYGWVPIVVGGAAVATGAAFFVMAKQTEARIQGPNDAFASRDDLLRAGAEGKQRQLIAAIAGGGGVAAIAAGAAMYLMGGDEEVALIVTPDSAAVSASLRF